MSIDHRGSSATISFNEVHQERDDRCSHVAVEVNTQELRLEIPLTKRLLHALFNFKGVDFGEHLLLMLSFCEANGISAKSAQDGDIDLWMLLRKSYQRLLENSKFSEVRFRADDWALSTIRDSRGSTAYEELLNEFWATEPANA